MSAFDGRADRARCGVGVCGVLLVLIGVVGCGGPVLVEGRVIDRHDAPVPGAVVESTLEPPEQTVGRDGRFVLRISAPHPPLAKLIVASVRVTARKGPDQVAEADIEVDLTGRSPRQTLILVLRQREAQPPGSTAAQ